MNDGTTDPIEKSAENQRVSNDVDDVKIIETNGDANPRNKLSAFAYEAPE